MPGETEIDCRAGSPSCGGGGGAPEIVMYAVGASVALTSAVAYVAVVGGERVAVAALGATCTVLGTALGAQFAVAGP